MASASKRLCIMEKKEWNLRRIQELCNNKDLLINYLKDKNLIKSEMKCPKCGWGMRMYKNTFWKCNKSVRARRGKKICETKISAFRGSWFGQTKLKLEKVMGLTYMLIYNYEHKKISRELEISEVTVSQWSHFVKQVLVEWLMFESEPVGGPGKVVEIDESKFGKRKYHRGHAVEGQWVFGGVELETQKVFLVPVPDRSIDTLIPLIKKWILPGSTVISDCWKAYAPLNEEGYQHLQVNHSLNFVDPDTGAHTNMVESIWRHVKAFLPSYSRIFKEKRQFSTTKTKCNYREDIDREYENQRENNFGERFGKRYDDRFNNRFNNRFTTTYDNRLSGRYRKGNGSRFGKFSNNIIDEATLDWSSETLKPFKRDFYTPHPDVINRSANEIEAFHKKHDIQIFGQNCPAPIFNFLELGLPREVSDYLSHLNYDQPTPIQSQTWPIALSGRDMVGISRTGSGKTLGYILPAVIHIQNQPPLAQHEGPLALVLAPTRELVQQIQDVTYPIARTCNMRTASLFGGASKITQMNEIRHIKEIYVATPGRLLDFLKDEVTNLKRCTYLVLDEADQMLNMGFEPQIRSIISRIRPDRQVLMWSATWPREIRDLANSYLKNYIKVQVGSEELSANPNIIQVIHVCQEEEKLNLLIKILSKISEEPKNKTLIFAQTKYGVEKVGRYLLTKGLRAKTLHGDHSQNLRTRIMNDFRRGYCKILVATNVAGRGLDVNDIKYVINFDFPQTVEEYVHKIGRTARSDNSGTAHTFFTPENAALAHDLISVLENTNQIISPELKELACGKYSHRDRRFW